MLLTYHLHLTARQLGFDVPPHVQYLLKQFHAAKVSDGFLHDYDSDHNSYSVSRLKKWLSSP